MISQHDIEQIAELGRDLPPAKGVYIETDFITNLMATVIDYQTQTVVVERAISHYKKNRWDEIRDIGDLESAFDRFPDTPDGNKELAQHLWGYDMWTRAEQLRRLTAFFSSIGVTDQPALKEWAERSTFEADFQGNVKGLGPAVYQWLIMRQGVDTVKPDVHVRRFAERAVQRSLSDKDLVSAVEQAAVLLDLTALEFDWRIWEWSREQPIEGQESTPRRTKREVPQFLCMSCFATKPENLRSPRNSELCVDCDPDL